VRTKLKNYITGNTMERTFRGGEPVETAEVYKTDTQFTYVDGDEFVFMDNVRAWWCVCGGRDR
jgi:translation elongation factor P/translation initiation factor 5A